MRHVLISLPGHARRSTIGLAAPCGLLTLGCGVTEQPEDSPDPPRPAFALMNHSPPLRVGWMGMDGRVGTGPGDDRVGPIYKVVQWNPHTGGPRGHTRRHRYGRCA